MPIAHFFRRAILTGKVGQTDLAFGMRSGFISGARHGLGGCPQMGRLTPTVKHNGQESGGTLCEIFKF